MMVNYVLSRHSNVVKIILHWLILNAYIKFVFIDSHDNKEVSRKMYTNMYTYLYTYMHEYMYVYMY